MVVSEYLISSIRFEGEHADDPYVTQSVRTQRTKSYLKLGGVRGSFPNEPVYLLANSETDMNVL